MTAEQGSIGEAKQPSLPFPLQGNEQVIQVCRRHWWFLWPRTILLALVGIVPVLVAAWLLSAVDVFDGMTRNVFLVIALIWLLWWGLQMFLGWYRYNNDLWAITNQRIVDSFKPHPFSHRLSSADLVNVQDITVEKHGVLQSIMNFGDVICDTASGGKDFTLTGVPDPEQVQLLMDRERDRERTRGR
jgi:hypothetical protein